MTDRLRSYLNGHPKVKRLAVRARGLARKATGRSPVPNPSAKHVPWGHMGDHLRVFDLSLPVSPRGDRPLRRAHVVAPARCIVPRRLQLGGVAGFELDSVATFLGLCEAAPSGAVLDIGANTGHYAFLARVYSSREVIAFEPVPELASVARAIGDSNGFSFPVEEIAISDEAGTATFYLSDTSDSSSSLRRGFRPSTRQISVSRETLDSYVRRSGHNPAIVKIDTEATEPDVIRGGLATLQEHRPWVICEVLRSRGATEIEELLLPLGYLLYRLGDQVPYALEERLVSDPDQYNWLFAPAPASDALWSAIQAWRQALVGT